MEYFKRNTQLACRCLGVSWSYRNLWWIRLTEARGARCCGCKQEKSLMRSRYSITSEQNVPNNERCHRGKSSEEYRTASPGVGTEQSSCNYQPGAVLCGSGGNKAPDCGKEPFHEVPHRQVQLYKQICPVRTACMWGVRYLIPKVYMERKGAETDRLAMR